MNDAVELDVAREANVGRLHLLQHDETGAEPVTQRVAVGASDLDARRDGVEHSIERAHLDDSALHEDRQCGCHRCRQQAAFRRLGVLERRLVDGFEDAQLLASERRFVFTRCASTSVGRLRRCVASELCLELGDLRGHVSALVCGRVALRRSHCCRTAYLSLQCSHIG